MTRITGAFDRWKNANDCGKRKEGRCGSLYGKWIAVIMAGTLQVLGALAVDIPFGEVAIRTESSVPNPVPSAITDKAAFWMNMDDISVVSEDDGKTLSMWRDVRETAAKDGSPTRYYATPAWTNGGETATVSLEYSGVNPAIERLGSAQRKTLNFHGRSGIFLRLKKNGADAKLNNNVRHVFAVHNPSNWFGAVVGGVTDNRKGAFQLQPADKSYMYRMSSGSPLCWYRVDLNVSHSSEGLGWLGTTMSLAVDGTVVDQYAYKPHQGWQLLDAAFLDHTLGATVEAIFFQRYENGSNDTAHRAGGDYLSEVMVFTNQLSNAEIADIRTYLSRKWGLPTWRDPEVLDARNYLVPPKPVESLAIGPEATGTADVANDAVSRPFYLNGDGVIDKTGDGAMVIGASQGLTPFGGVFNLNAGSVYLRGGLPPAITAKSGDRMTSLDYVVGDNTPENQAAGGVKISMAKADRVTDFVKDGGCPAVVKDVDQGVKRIAVTEGELTLGAAQDVGYRGEVPVENGDVEAPFHCPSGDNQYSVWAFNLCKIPSAGSNGWFGVGNPSAFFQRLGNDCTFADGSLVRDAQTADGKKWRGTSPWNLLTTVGSGCQVINLQNGTIYTKVSIPAVGCYELSFDQSTRYAGESDRPNAKPLEVLFGKSTDDWKVVSYSQATVKHWTNVKVLLPKTEAGEYLIGFQNDSRVSGDSSSFIDNVSLRFVSRNTRDTFAIPNGDFERFETPAQSVAYFSVDNAALNWSFTSPESPDGFNPLIGIVNPNIALRSEASCFANRDGACSKGDDHYGVAALMMIGNQVSASTTFTPPAGRWRLRQRLQRTFVYSNHSLSFYGSSANELAYCSATVNVGGQEMSLGRISAPSSGGERFKRVDYPTVFETDGRSAVTLILSTPDNAKIGVLVDDLELVSEASIADSDGELIRDGGFENADAGVWIAYNPPMPSGQIARTNNGGSYKKYLESSSYAYGVMQYEGTSAYMLKNLRGVRQEIDFPKAGLYRLRFGLRSRADGANFANGDLAVKLCHDGATNQIAFINYKYQRNFSEREYLFAVPCPGKCILAFENYGTHNGAGTAGDEATCLIDGVSVCLVDWKIPERLSLAQDMAIAVKDGATLNLAFTGTNVVRSVSFGGQSVFGKLVGATRVVNSQTCPDFVSGPGSLEIKPHGLVMVVR